MKGYERNSCNQIRETDRQMDGGTDIKHGNWNIQMYNFYTIFHFSTEVFCDLMSCVFFYGYQQHLRQYYCIHLQSSQWLKTEIS